MAEPERAEERTGPHAGEHWDAVWTAFRDHYVKYQSENPSWQAFFTEHHMYALDEALRAYDKARGTQAASDGPIAIEHGLLMSGGGVQTRADGIEEIYPLADWIEHEQRFGGKVMRRRVIVVEDWTEVPRG